MVFGKMSLLDWLFRDVWNIPIMEKVIKERFNGKYPARKSIQTEFAHTGGENGLQFQLDGIAYVNVKDWKSLKATKGLEFT